MRRSLFFAGVLLAAIATANASEAELVLRLQDARTGEPVTNVRCGLVDRSDRIYAKFEGTRYSGGRKPREGDVLYVYSRGYDLIRRVLAAGETEISARMQPCEEFAEIVLEDAGVTATAQVHFEPHGYRRREEPLSDSLVREVQGSLRLAIPRGMRASALVGTSRGILWPHVVALRPGQPARIHWEPPAEIPILRGRAEVEKAECVPDRMWNPPVPPRRVDAWRWHMGGPSWLRHDLLEGREILTLSPQIRFHLFARIGGLPVYRHVTPESKAIDLRGPFRTKRVAGRPLVNGELVPDGTFLAPGRLDPYAITRVWDVGLVGGVHRIETGAWPKVELPEAEVLSVWHIDVGLAHLPWRKGERPRGETYPGVLLVTLPPGWNAKGYVSVFPVWRGAGTVRATPPDNYLRKHFRSSRLRFPGLRPGLHGLDIQVALTHLRSGRRHEIHRMDHVDVPEDAPQVVLELEVP